METPLPEMKREEGDGLQVGSSDVDLSAMEAGSKGIKEGFLGAHRLPD